MQVFDWAIECSESITNRVEAIGLSEQWYRAKMELKLAQNGHKNAALVLSLNKTREARSVINWSGAAERSGGAERPHLVCHLACVQGARSIYIYICICMYVCIPNIYYIYV